MDHTCRNQPGARNRQLIRASSLTPIVSRRKLTALLGAVGSLSVIPNAHAERRYTLRLATWGSSLAPQVTNFVGLFKTLVATNGHGQLIIEDFPGGSLVQENAVPSAIENHVVDISLTTYGSWDSIVPFAHALNTILFAPQAEDFLHTIGPGTPLFNAFDTAMTQRGAKVLGVLYNGPVVVMSHKPMNTPGAFHGKTVRVFDRLTSEIVETLGAAPSTIDVADVYPALERGTVQAAIGGLEGVYGLKEYEVAKYCLATNGAFGLLLTGYVMDAHSYAALPKNLQAVVRHAAYTATKAANQAMIKAYATEVAAMRAHGTTVTVLKRNSPAYETFSKALLPLAAKERARIAPAVLKLLRSVH